MLTRLFHYFSFFLERACFTVVAHWDNYGSLLANFIVLGRNFGNDRYKARKFFWSAIFTFIVNKRNKPLGFKHLSYSQKPYYDHLIACSPFPTQCLEGVISYMHCDQPWTSILIRASALVACNGIGWDEAVGLNISVHLFVAYSVHNWERQKYKSGRVIDWNACYRLFYEWLLDPISYFLLCYFFLFLRMCLSDVLSQGKRPEGAAGAPRAEDATRGECSDGKRTHTRMRTSTHMQTIY